MIHRHYGTKERLLVEIFQLFTDYGADHIRASETIDEAIERTFTIDAGGFARILAWVALDGVAPERTFADTSGMAVFQRLIQRGWAADGPPAPWREHFDPRVVSSVVQAKDLIAGKPPRAKVDQEAAAEKAEDKVQEVRRAHHGTKKAGGSSRNGRDTAGRRLGVKKFGGEARRRRQHHHPPARHQLAPRHRRRHG